MKERIVKALRGVFDPEIPMNIYDLGLVYGIETGEDGQVSIRMTLTAPNCPVAGSMPAHVEQAVRAVSGVKDVKVELTFDPPWSKELMSEEAKLMLGIDDVVPTSRLQR